MKKLLLIVAIVSSFTAGAQSKQDIRILNATRQLHMAVFRDKDSAKLVELLAENLSYGHSGGKVENREEAIQGIIHNKSAYETHMMGAISICVSGNTAITHYVYETDEIKADDSRSRLKIRIMMVWAQERNKWKLITRQAVKLS